MFLKPETVTDEPERSSTQFNKHKSFMSALMTDITECCMTFAQSRHRKGREGEKDEGLERGWQKRETTEMSSG